MMEETNRSEELYAQLFSTLAELAEYESPEVIFDRIVDDFATSAEYHMGQANTFKGMLDTFRHDNPAETIPEAVSDTIDPPYGSYEDMFGGISDINKQYMLEDRDNLIEFLRASIKTDKYSQE